MNSKIQKKKIEKDNDTDGWIVLSVKGEKHNQGKCKIEVLHHVSRKRAAISHLPVSVISSFQ